MVVIVVGVVSIESTRSCHVIRSLHCTVITNITTLTTRIILYSENTLSEQIRSDKKYLLNI